MPSDLSNQQKRIYLSDVLDLSKFKKGQANIILAPCHSGKTTAAFHKLAKLSTHPEQVIFLIDTAAGKEALLKQDGAAPYSKQWFEDIKMNEWWGELLSGSGIRVMTYHQLGYRLLADSNFLENIQVVICDEMHNLIRYKNMECDDTGVGPCETALVTLSRLANAQDGPFILIMTATEKQVRKALDKRGVRTEYFNFRDKVTCDKTARTVYYSDINEVLSSLGKSERAIVFVQSIKQMKKAADVVDDGHRRVCCLWSVHKQDDPMSAEQLDVRKSILTHRKIPDWVDILLINSAYETSLNIENKDFQTIIIHSGSEDTRTQVRGRLRHDIETMYLYDSEHEHVADYFPTEYYGKFLDSATTSAIAQQMDMTDEKGHVIKWPTIVKKLRANGVIASQVRQNGIRGWVLKKIA